MNKLLNLAGMYSSAGKIPCVALAWSGASSAAARLWWLDIMEKNISGGKEKKN